MVKRQRGRAGVDSRSRAIPISGLARAVPRTLTSTRHPLVKTIHALEDSRYRRSEHLLVIEGVRMLEEALEAGIAINVLLYDPAVVTDPRALAVLTKASTTNAQLFPAHPRVIAASSQVKTPQGIIAIAEAPQADFAGLLSASQLLLAVGDRLQDPGNLGTLIRLADAAGATGVVVTEGSVDPHHPKVLRASAGSIFHLPVTSAPAEAVITGLQTSGVRTLAADQKGVMNYTDVDFRPPVALIFGNEGAGLDPRWIAVASATVRIPLYGRADSLNVAVAAGILLYEVRRQVH